MASHPFHPAVRPARRLGLAAVAAAWPLLSPLAVVAADAPAPAVAACGATLSPAVAAVWNTLGGETGLLGCPVGREDAAAPSPQGTAARQVLFAGGGILWHGSGPRAGQAFAVTGCAWRLYFQYGGSAGWLGLPVSDAANTPDGRRQTFEGGVITYHRALDSCTATAAPPQAEVALGDDADAIAPLELFQAPGGGDYMSVASPGGQAAALAGGYTLLGVEGYVFTRAAPGRIALKLYWDETRHVHQTVASPQGERAAQESGAAFEGGQGFVWTDPRPAAVALKLFATPAGAGELVGGDADEARARAAGYAFVRVEGYAQAGASR